MKKALLVRAFFISIIYLFTDYNYVNVEIYN